MHDRPTRDIEQAGPATSLTPAPRVCDCLVSELVDTSSCLLTHDCTALVNATSQHTRHTYIPHTAAHRRTVTHTAALLSHL